MEVNTLPLSDAADFVETFNAIVSEIGGEVAAEVRPAMLDELRYTPPEWTGGKREWESERQRRAYFASDGFGAGIPYVRTGKYAGGWVVISETTDGSFELTVGNAEPYAPFVGGTLNQRSRSEAQRWQQRMHINTGWPLQVDTLAFWLDASLELFDQKLFDRLENLGERTTTRRRSYRT